MLDMVLFVCVGLFVTRCLVFVVYSSLIVDVLVWLCFTLRFVCCALVAECCLLCRVLFRMFVRCLVLGVRFLVVLFVGCGSLCVGRCLSCLLLICDYTSLCVVCCVLLLRSSLCGVSCLSLVACCLLCYLLRVYFGVRCRCALSVVCSLLCVRR